MVDWRQLGTVGIFGTWIEAARRRRESSRFLREGNRLYQKGDFEQAAAAYRSGVDVDPDRLVLRFNLGLALYKGGRKADGREEWKRVLEGARKAENAYMAEQTEIMLRQFG